MNADWLILFTLVFARVGGLIFTVPIFGTGEVPMQVRLLLVAALSLLIAPMQWSGAGIPIEGLIPYLLILGCEAVIGACLGLGITIFFHGMTIAGELIGQASGLSIAEVFDPELGDNVPLFSRLMFLTAVSVFLCIGGHRAVMAGLLDTFRTLPPGGSEFPDSVAAAFTTLVAQSFSLGLRAAAPAVTALLLATLILGLIGRTLPQLNVFAVGFGLNSLLAFAALGLSLGAAVWAFQNEIEPAMNTLFEVLKTPLRTQWMM
jgi:flagellar biosynthesis protein FliR